jgi:hypothetical protein
MEVFKDTHLVKLELLSNATTIDSALHYIGNKQQEQNKRLSLNSATAGSKDNNNNNSDDSQLSAGRQTVF